MVNEPQFDLSGYSQNELLELAQESVDKFNKNLARSKRKSINNLVITSEKKVKNIARVVIILIIMAMVGSGVVTTKVSNSIEISETINNNSDGIANAFSRAVKSNYSEIERYIYAPNGTTRLEYDILEDYILEHPEVADADLYMVNRMGQANGYTGTTSRLYNYLHHDAPELFPDETFDGYIKTNGIADKDGNLDEKAWRELAAKEYEAYETLYGTKGAK